MDAMERNETDALMAIHFGDPNSVSDNDVTCAVLNAVETMDQDVLRESLYQMLMGRPGPLVINIKHNLAENAEAYGFKLPDATILDKYKKIDSELGKILEFPLKNLKNLNITDIHRG